MHHASPAELKEQIEAERRGAPFLVLRDGDGGQRIVTLERDRVTVGRAAGADLALVWDSEVSRAHAELERLGSDWTVGDDGLSRNGSFVNGERVSGRRRLADGDVLRFGNTSVTFRRPSGGGSVETVVADESVDATLTDAQRRVLVALCRPYRDGSPYATPATNQQIGEELFLSVDGVKTHLRTLFAKFGVEGLPQNQKRVRLVERALQSGAISPRDL